MLIQSATHTSTALNNISINIYENVRNKEFGTGNISNNIVLCWCKLFEFSCRAVRIYDGGNIGSNFVKCYECCVPLHISALITKVLSPDGTCTKTDALYSLIMPLHCYIG